MQNNSTAQSGYAKINAPLRDERQKEYDIFAQVTASLIRAKSADFSQKVNALHENKKLWIALASDLANPENKLPRDLRARLFFLAEFTFDLTRKSLQNGCDFNALIEVNTSIMNGLSNNKKNAG